VAIQSRFIFRFLILCSVNAEIPLLQRSDNGTERRNAPALFRRGYYDFRVSRWSCGKRAAHLLLEFCSRSTSLTLFRFRQHALNVTAELSSNDMISSSTFFKRPWRCINQHEGTSQSLGDRINTALAIAAISQQWAEAHLHSHNQVGRRG